MSVPLKPNWIRTTNEIVEGKKSPNCRAVTQTSSRQKKSSARTNRSQTTHPVDWQSLSLKSEANILCSKNSMQPLGAMKIRLFSNVILIQNQEMAVSATFRPTACRHPPWHAAKCAIQLAAMEYSFFDSTSYILKSFLNNFCVAKAIHDAELMRHN